MGGGIENGDPNLPSAAPKATLNRSAVIENTSDVVGGGIWNVGSGDLVLESSAVIENVAGLSGGGIFNAGGIVTLTQSILARNTPNNCDGC
jgi:hypothetical protein